LEKPMINHYRKVHFRIQKSCGERAYCTLLPESSLNDYTQDIKKLNTEVVSRKKLFFEEPIVLMFK
jgi:hypothetical protein